MRVRFETVLWQIANANRKPRAHAPAPVGRKRSSHLEERIRARERRGERIAFGLSIALAVSSIGFAAHAIGNRTTHPSLPSILPSFANGIPTNRAMAAAVRKSGSLEPDTTGSVAERAEMLEKSREADAAAQTGERDTARGRGYVLHRVLAGVALVEGPEGLQQVIPGHVLPGAGRVMSIEQSQAGWIVVTSETVIGTAPL